MSAEHCKRRQASLLPWFYNGFKNHPMKTGIKILIVLAMALVFINTNPALAIDRILEDGVMIDKLTHFAKSKEK